MSEPRIKKAVMGIVQRVARNGSWADVKWRGWGGDWTKRMPAHALVIETTLPLHGFAPGWTVTDCTREAELSAQGA